MKSYAIADVDAIPDETVFFESLAEVSAAGVDYIQLRAKCLEGRALLRVAERCRKVIPPDGARFLINGRADVAVAAGADGVHLASNGMPVAAARRVSPSLIVGRSCHTVGESVAARKEGADYIFLGPVFRPRSKNGKANVSLGELRSAAGTIPTFALGGISLENLRDLEGLGLAGVAAITMFLVDRPLDVVIRTVREL